MTSNELDKLLDFLEGSEEQTPCDDEYTDGLNGNFDDFEIDVESEEFKEYMKIYCGNELLAKYWYRRWNNERQ